MKYVSFVVVLLALFTVSLAAQSPYHFVTLDIAPTDNAIGLQGQLGLTSVAAAADNGKLLIGTTAGPYSYILDKYEQFPITCPGMPPLGTGALRINKHGAIAGFCGHSAFLLEPNGTTYKLFNFPGAFITSARGLNDENQVVGLYSIDTGHGSAIHGYLWSKGHFTTIDFPGADRTELSSINNLGQMVGSYIVNTSIVGPSFDQGFVYDAGTFTTLAFPDPNALGTFPSGINDKGQVVGIWTQQTGPTNSTFVNHGFLYDMNTGVYTNLDAPFTGFITELYDITNGGQIVGRVYKLSPTGGSADSRGLLITP